MPKAGKNKKKYMNVSLLLLFHPRTSSQARHSQLAPPPNRVGRSRGKVEGPGVWVTCVKVCRPLLELLPLAMLLTYGLDLTG